MKIFFNRLDMVNYKHHFKSDIGLEYTVILQQNFSMNLKVITHQTLYIFLSIKIYTLYLIMHVLLGIGYFFLLRVKFKTSGACGLPIVVDVIIVHCYWTFQVEERIA